MIPKKEVSFFKRYLKEKGLYNVFKLDLFISLKYGKAPIKKIIEKGHEGDTTDIIMRCLLWSCSNYGVWHKIYRDYSNYYYEKNKKNKC